jgi:hypothetical protein
MSCIDDTDCGQGGWPDCGQVALIARTHRLWISREAMSSIHGNFGMHRIMFAKYEDEYLSTGGQDILFPKRRCSPYISYLCSRSPSVTADLSSQRPHSGFGAAGYVP